MTMIDRISPQEEQNSKIQALQNSVDDLNIKMDALMAIVQEAREGIAGATANPMFRMMLKNFGLGG